MLLVDGRRDVVEPASLVVAEADLDDDRDLGDEELSPVGRPAELGRRDEHPVVVPQRGEGVDERLHGAAGTHDEADLERLPGRAGVCRGEGRELARRRGRHEQRPDVGGIRPGASVEVLADGHVERGESGREDRGVVDEAVEERRERRP